MLTWTRKVKNRSDEELYDLLRSRPLNFREDKSEDIPKLVSHFKNLVERVSDEDLKRLMVLTFSRWRHNVILDIYHSRHPNTLD